MTRLIEVKRIPIAIGQPFNYPAVKAEVIAAIERQEEVTVEGQYLVIRRRVDLRGSGRAA
jgi:hypothetical protein